MRKGVSDILALVIIIAILISIGSIFVYWSKHYGEDVTDGVTDQGKSAARCMKEIIAISDIYINTSQDTIQFVVNNKGTSSVDLSSATAYNMSGHYCSLNFSQASIPAGGMTIINSSACSIYPSCDAFHYVEAITACSTNAVKDSLTSSQCS